MKNPLKKLIKSISGKKITKRTSKSASFKIKKQEKKIIDSELLEKLRNAGYKGPFGAENITQTQQLHQQKIKNFVKKRRERKKIMEKKLEKPQLIQTMQNNIQQTMISSQSITEPQTKNLSKLIRQDSEIKETDKQATQEQSKKAQYSEIEKKPEEYKTKTETATSSASGVGILYSEPKKIQNLNKKKILD